MLQLGPEAATLINIFLKRKKLQLISQKVPTDISIIRWCFEQLHANKLDNLEEKNTFPEINKSKQIESEKRFHSFTEENLFQAILLLVYETYDKMQ